MKDKVIQLIRENEIDRIYRTYGPENPNMWLTIESKIFRFIYKQGCATLTIHHSKTFDHSSSMSMSMDDLKEIIAALFEKKEVTDKDAIWHPGMK